MSTLMIFLISVSLVGLSAICLLIRYSTKHRDGDYRASGGAWDVNFSYGGVLWYFGNNDYVRAVRSLQ